jgi:hypothetical protein
MCVGSRAHRMLTLKWGSLKSAPLKWLPVLSNIAPTKFRREQALIWEWAKINSNKSLPIHDDPRFKEDKLRLRSRKSLWVVAKKL